MLDYKVDSGQRLIERDLLFEKNIGTLSLKLLVGLFLHDNDDIAGLNARCLICLAMEGVLAIIRSTLINHCVKNFLLFVDLFTFTSCASSGLINDLTLTIAVIARALGLGVHAGSELGHLHDYTTTTASCALLYCAFSASSALANLANSLSVHGNFRGLAVENFFKSTFERVHDGLAFLRSATFTAASTSHAKHLLKEASTTHAAATTTSFFDCFQAVPIVCFTFFTITQNLISLLNFLELCFVTSTIGMMGPGELMVGFLNGGVVSILINS